MIFTTWPLLRTMAWIGQLNHNFFLDRELSLAGSRVVNYSAPPKPFNICTSKKQARSSIFIIFFYNTSK
ncbi:unnamed protein product [Rhizophagus irregularis]|uniref:Uncharacterized protein n=1 Tax=Rhizophagus irregularis TaxID=588596 RepID=A0A915Z9Q5_9GLOM|nr:unnamed protein product [Rhizophagus irregularis]